MPHRAGYRSPCPDCGQPIYPGSRSNHYHSKKHQHALGRAAVRRAADMAAAQRFNRIGDPDVGGPDLDEVPF